ncbi:unnamed protein product [Clavelina lepadiformis]|uniref:Uncharacterized protein n=1 Tax=Clavelina lepadiformis TaxID=159417 RepID=A0ABP0FVF1_CLALP
MELCLAPPSLHDSESVFEQVRPSELFRSFINVSDVQQHVSRGYKDLKSRGCRAISDDFQVTGED